MKKSKGIIVACINEKEMGQIKTNMALMQRDVSHIKELFETELAPIIKEIYGNGKEGLIKETKNNTNFRLNCIGGAKLTIIVGILLSVIGTIIAICNNMPK